MKNFNKITNVRPATCEKNTINHFYSRENTEINIPHEIMDDVAVGHANVQAMRVNDALVLITAQKKTAFDILEIVESLHQYTSVLIVELALACGSCTDFDDCDDCYDCDDCMECSDIDDEDLDLLPDVIVKAFSKSNVCFGNLFDLIDSDEVIYED